MQVVLIRHGLTVLGEQGRYQGTVDTPLSQNGRRMLHQADFVPDLLAVSPLQRARETADLLFPSCCQTIVPDLREMNFGVFEGRVWYEMEKDPLYREWVAGGCLAKCPEGEDRMSFSRRVCRAFENILTDASAFGFKRVAIVAHGGTQMAVLEKWGRPSREYYQGQTACGHGWLLETDSWPEALFVNREIDYTV